MKVMFLEDAREASFDPDLPWMGEMYQKYP